MEVCNQTIKNIFVKAFFFKFHLKSYQYISIYTYIHILYINQIRNDNFTGIFKIDRIIKVFSLSDHLSQNLVKQID